MLVIMVMVMVVCSLTDKFVSPSFFVIKSRFFFFFFITFAINSIMF